MSFEVDIPTTEEVLAAVLSSSLPALPPSEQRLGSTLVSWWETAPGEVYIHAEGGTGDDRHYARTMVGLELMQHGYTRRTFDLDVIHLGSRRTASWVDIMNKAKRLIQSGQIQVLRNGFNYIVGHIIGDHGEYDTEISRDNPDSRAITGWQCSCPWDQYAWQRTRKWKKFEGRPCHLPGSMVTMADGTYKPIEDVRIGDRVVTHDGVGIVEQTMVRDVEESVVHIWRSGFPHPLRMTENHEVWALKTPAKLREAAYNQPEYLKRSGQGFKFNKAEFLQDEPEWIDAGSLQERDWVASTWAVGSPVEVSMALAIVAGYYLAEGNIVKNEVQWTFHENEVELHQALISALEVLNLEFKPRVYDYEARNSISIRITSPWLVSELIRLCGTGSRSKFVHGEIVSQWPVEQAWAFVEAYLEGDGDLKAGGRQALNTTSDAVARALYDLLVRCGYQPSWHQARNNGGPQNRGGELFINRITFQRSPQTRGNGRQRLEDHYLSMITKVERHHYAGPVYNLKVSDQESYVTEGVTNHNCSHVLALYWKALATPMDEQLTEEQANALGTGQALPKPGVPEHPPEIEKDIMEGEKHQDHLPRSFGPEGDINQGDQTQMNLPPDALGQPPGPAQAPLAPPPATGPQPPGILPPFPGEQMQMQWGGPGTTPGGQKSPPGAYSVPGAKPPAQPANPIQGPGTFSHRMTANDWDARDDRRVDQAAYERFLERARQTPYGDLSNYCDDQECHLIAPWLTEEYPELRAEGGLYAHPERGSGDHSWNVAPDGTIIDVTGIQHDPEHPVVVPSTDPRYQNYVGYENPRYHEMARSMPWCPYCLAEKPEGQDHGCEEETTYRTSAASFQPPQVVRLKNPVMGLAEGPEPGQYGDGEYQEIQPTKPNGSPTLGEVLSQDDTTGWIEVIFPLDDTGYHAPFHVRCFVEPSDIEVTGQTNAFIRRRH